MSDCSATHDTVVPAPTSVLLPVVGDSRRFPVHRVYCVGRNYAAHAVEMGHDPNKEPPFFFQKNPDNLLCGVPEMPYPPATSDLHHEIELVVALQAGGRDIPTARALDYVYGYAVALDMRELLRTNDPVKLSWIQALLADAGIEAVVLDTHTSIVEGSIGAIPRRLCVLAEDLERARRVLEDAGEGYSEW